MPTDIETVDPKAAYADLLEQLRLLSRDMLLAFRLQVGQILLDRFYDGDIREYRNTFASKDTSFAAFVRTCPSDLTDLGLGGQVARPCINARVTYDLLPPSVRDGLLFSHVVELTRLEDPTTRARLARDTTLQKWSVDQLKDAIEQLAIGNYYDTDSAMPGTVRWAPLARRYPLPHGRGSLGSADAWLSRVPSYPDRPPPARPARRAKDANRGATASDAAGASPVAAWSPLRRRAQKVFIPSQLRHQPLGDDQAVASDNCVLPQRASPPGAVRPL